MIIHGVAPTAIAASITPLSISRNAVSTILAKKGIADTDRETEAALGPIVDPVNRSVKGRRATKRMMNGIERTILTATPRDRFTMLFSKNKFLVVVNSNTPRGKPISRATARETPTI